MPILFVPWGANPADDFVDIARRFADDHRVLAITPRTAATELRSLEGMTDDAARAGDVTALLDSLDIERVVLIGSPGELTYFAEHRPERLAGLIYLQQPRVFDDHLALARQDPTGAAEMFLRALAVDLYGVDDHEELARHLSVGRPRYLEDPESRIRVHALTFVNRTGTRGDDRSRGDQRPRAAAFRNSCRLTRLASTASSFIDQSRVQVIMVNRVKLLVAA